MGKKRLVLAAVISALAMIACMVFLGCGGKPEPKVDSISPASGEAGTRVEISGSDFGKTMGTVSLGGETAGILSWSDTSITANVPSDLEAGLYDVSVKTEGGTSMQTQFKVTEKEDEDDGDGEDEDGEDGESEIEAVMKAMRSFVEANSAPGLEFEIENIQIHGDEAAATVTSEAGPALVLMKKGESGWYGVDLGTGFEPPSWYQQ